jgi:hypothetical protein
VRHTIAGHRELLAVVIDVLDTLDRHVVESETEDEADETTPDPKAPRWRELETEAQLMRILNVAHADQIVETVAQLVKESVRVSNDRERLAERDARITELEKQLADALAAPAAAPETLTGEVRAAVRQALGLHPTSGESTLDAATRVMNRLADLSANVTHNADLDAIGNALCKREGETLLRAAERNRDRIIELAHQVDALDTQIALALRGIDLPVGTSSGVPSVGLVAAVADLLRKCQAENKRLKEKIERMGA